MGDEGPGIIPADMIFVVEEKPHAVFQREVWTTKKKKVGLFCFVLSHFCLFI